MASQPSDRRTDVDSIRRISNFSTATFNCTHACRHTAETDAVSAVPSEEAESTALKTRTHQVRCCGSVKNAAVSRREPMAVPLSPA